MGSVIRFLSQRLVPLAYAFLVSVSVYPLPLFTFISAFIFRLHRDENFVEKNGEEINFLEAETELSPECTAEKDVTEFIGFDSDAREEKEEVFLKFKFPTFEEFCRIHEKTDNLTNSEAFSFPSSSKYDFTSGKISVSDSIDQLETLPVEEINAQRKCELGKSGQHYYEILVCNEEANDNTESEEFVEKSEEKEENFLSSVQEDEKLEGNQGFLDEPECFSEKNSMCNGSCSDLIDVEHILSSVIHNSADSHSDGFLSDEDFGLESMQESSSGFDENLESSKDFRGAACLDSIDVEHIPPVINNSADSHSDGFLSDEDFGLESMQEPSSGFDENLESSKDFRGAEEMDATEEELNKSTEPCDLHNPDEVNTDFLSEEDFTGAGFLADSTNKMESSWEVEHQDLIDQLKMELRKVRDSGLPTILEETESPKIMEDLNPWKIDDEKAQRENRMAELHKFYKSYRERMRKLDILNYQKMYAMGLLQLKDPLQSKSNKKPSAPSLKSLVSQNLWLSKHKVHGSDPMKKFIAELEGDVEVVYVGQMCVSWEMLYWQYEKALDLWDSDPRGIYRYNEVAGEFQQFQVLMQRFIEDEPFQGPRVQNYAKTRCVLRNLLQVPVIRVDNTKDKKWREWTKGRDEHVITIETLVEIVEESIRIYWRFVKADKDSTSTLPISTHNKIVPQLHDPEDLSLLLVVKKTLQKKERKLKDILRGENCILRRFRRNQEEDWDQVLSFFSQVDMRLVSRVLRMSRITRDQLIWCHDKLNRISFVNRKMNVEPGFLLFPC